MARAALERCVSSVAGALGVGQQGFERVAAALSHSRATTHAP